MGSLSRPTLALRLGRLADAAAIAELSRQEIEQALEWTWQASRVAARIRDAETVVLVAEIGGRLVGFAIMRFGMSTAHLHLMAVQRDFRRCGIARQMLGWLTHSARTAGIRRIHLEVRERNRGAREFYAAVGFEVLDRVPGYYQGIEAALRMVKHLTPATAGRG